MSLKYEEINDFIIEKSLEGYGKMEIYKMIAEEHGCPIPSNRITAIRTRLRKEGLLKFKNGRGYQ